MKIDSQARCIHLAYRYLETVTPLAWDCGKLCGKRCCKGDERTGMWLLPGEEALLKGKKNFSVQPCQDNSGYPLLVCSGSCDRKHRPFACRIYPFFPLVTQTEEKGLELEIICDPRAKECPLARYTLWKKDADEDTTASRRVKITQSFRFGLRQAALALLDDREIREYLLETSSFLREIAMLEQKLGRH